MTHASERPPRWGQIPYDPDEQLDWLMAQGLVLPNPDRVRHYLLFIGAHRLLPYAQERWLGDSARFAAGTGFDLLLKRYLFDRELRVLFLDALERVTVAFRGAVHATMGGEHGPQWALQGQLFRDPRRHALRVVALLEEVEPDLGDPSPGETPPQQLSLDAMNLAQMVELFGDLRHSRDQQRISRLFQLPASLLLGWMGELARVQRLASRQQMLCYRMFPPMLFHPDQTPCFDSPATLYPRACACLSMLRTTTGFSGHTRWASRLELLFTKYGEFVDPAALGFPEDWTHQPPWA
ncbi:MAG: Abi family protein [Magnetococcus sp. WYHC-3]